MLAPDSLVQGAMAEEYEAEEDESLEDYENRFRPR